MCYNIPSLSTRYKDLCFIGLNAKKHEFWWILSIFSHFTSKWSYQKDVNLGKNGGPNRGVLRKSTDIGRFIGIFGQKKGKSVQTA